MPLGSTAYALAAHIPSRGDWFFYGRSLSLLQSPSGIEVAILGDSGRCVAERVVIGLQMLNVNRLAATEATMGNRSDGLYDVIERERFLTTRLGPSYLV